MQTKLVLVHQYSANCWIVPSLLLQEDPALLGHHFLFFVHALYIHTLHANTSNFQEKHIQKWLKISISHSLFGVLLAVYLFIACICRILNTLVLAYGESYRVIYDIGTVVTHGRFSLCLTGLLLVCVVFIHKYLVKIQNFVH